MDILMNTYIVLYALFTIIMTFAIPATIVLVIFQVLKKLAGFGKKKPKTVK